MISLGRNIPNEFKRNGIDKSFDEIFGLICQNVQIDIGENRFVYFIDENYVFDSTKGYRWENLTPDYSKVLGCGLKELKYQDEEVTNDFCISYNSVLDNLIILAERVIRKLESDHTNRVKNIE